MAYRNAPLNPLLRLIYFLLRTLARLGTMVFYRRRLLIGREHLRFDGPAIVIVNHPNTLMDVLVPGVHVRQEMFFLANYGLFKNPVSGWLLRRLFCIPVKRREDVAEGENRDNDAAFEQSFRHLEKNGVLFIAPEGTSWMNRIVRPFKTGTARIAFGAESRHDWALGVKILPIGLTYSAPNRFRSESVVHVGQPVWVRDHAAAFQADHETAVDELTVLLENTIRNLTVDARDEAGDAVLGQWEAILRHEKPLRQYGAFRRSQRLAAHLDDEKLRADTVAYFEKLRDHNLPDAGVAAAARAGSGFGNSWRGLFLAFTLPVFLLGYGFWFLPCFLPAWLEKRLKLYVGYGATVKILAGLFTFPLALWGAFRLAQAGGQTGWSPWISLLAWVLFGLFAERWLSRARYFRDCRAARLFCRKNPAAFAALNAARLDIIQKLSH